ncbi:MAG TPA: hypothetical protein DEP42_01065 [Ruminococcaceae bacterium]|nr:hypothetical protein [Oscillospiraceae bacterium]
MASSPSGSTALATKIHAMYGKRLTRAHYLELIHKQSVPEIAAYLKQQTFYADLLHDVNESSVHRGQLESVLRQAIYQDYMRMLGYINPNERKFYRYFFVRMEIDELLRFLLYLNTDRESEYLFTLPDYFAKHTQVDLYSLPKIQNFEELLRLLEGTPYADVIRPFDPADGEIDTTLIASAFERYYYNYLNRAINSNFAGEAKDKLRRAVGVQMDLQNITQIIRLKRYFNVSPEDIRKILLPRAVRISQDSLDKMINAPDADGALGALSGTRYAEFFTPGSFEYVEEAANVAVFQYNEKLLATSTSSAVAMMAYLNLKSLELQNIITIIESVRYGLHPAETEKLLVGMKAVTK